MFSARICILITNGCKHLCIRRGPLCAYLMLNGASLLLENCDLTYQIEGLDRLNPVVDTLTNLRRLKLGSQFPEPTLGQTELRLLECLVALEGHLAGRSYRDIAAYLMQHLESRTQRTMCTPDCHFIIFARFSCQTHSPRSLAASAGSTVRGLIVISTVSHAQSILLAMSTEAERVPPQAQGLGEVVRLEQFRGKSLSGTSSSQGINWDWNAKRGQGLGIS